MDTKRFSHTRDLATLLNAGITYWLTIYPLARREIRHWTQRAEKIPDTELRAHALDKLARERLNPEAAAFFAILAPPWRRARLVRLLVDFQIAYDYLDAINETPDAAGLVNGQQLHRALSDAVCVQTSRIDYYRYHRGGEDGGYLRDLVHACRTSIRRLPSTRLIEPVLIHAAERCGEAQSRNHAVLIDGDAQLIDWTVGHVDSSGYQWWELAAGGISCLALHALFAAAASNATLEEATCIDGAYFPPVCAISALLDSLIDYPHDAGSSNHSFVAHYKSSSIAGERFAAITNEASALLANLKKHRRHRVILAGIASFYLSAPEARTRFARPIAAQTLNSLGRLAGPMLAVMRRKRRRI